MIELVKLKNEFKIRIQHNLFNAVLNFSERKLKYIFILIKLKKCNKIRFLYLFFNKIFFFFSFYEKVKKSRINANISNIDESMKINWC